MAKGKTKKHEVKQAAPAIARAEIISSRGRIFYGYVKKKFPKRIVIEFERTVYVQKYERFYKKKTKLHARLPDELADSINIGDYVKVQECRPLSKIIHFIVLGKVSETIKQTEEMGGKK